MSTGAAKSEGAASKPAKASRARLILTITTGDQSTDYRVNPVDPGFAGVRAFRLKKVSGDHSETHTDYDVVQTIDEIMCSCGDWQFRKEGSGKTCKHGAALVALGLLDDFDHPIPRANGKR